MAGELLVCILVSQLFSTLACPQEKSRSLTTPLASEILKSGKHKIVVMPLADPDGNIDALGAHISQMLSQDLNSALPGFEFIDPKTLRLSRNLDAKPETEKDSAKVLCDLAKSGGAEICIIGDFAPFKDQLGISLRAYRNDESLLCESYGEVPVDKQMIALAPKPLRYIPPPNGIFVAGLGGISKPTCLNCTPSDGSHRGSNLSEAGFASMDVVVDPDGRTHDVKILENSSAAFGSRAKEDAQTLRYTPATAPDGTPVAVRFRTALAIVTLEITVAVDGSVSQARVVRSSNKAFADEALDGVKKWKLKPAIGPNGRPVVSRVQVQITFRTLI